VPFLGSSVLSSVYGHTSERKQFHIEQTQCDTDLTGLQQLLDDFRQLDEISGLEKHLAQLERSMLEYAMIDKQGHIPDLQGSLEPQAIILGLFQSLQCCFIQLLGEFILPAVSRVRERNGPSAMDGRVRDSLWRPDPE
jgi:hypothetical protein